MKIFSAQSYPVRSFSFGNGAAASSAACTAAADVHRSSCASRDSYNREMADAASAHARYEADKAKDRARSKAYYDGVTKYENERLARALKLIDMPEGCEFNNKQIIDSCNGTWLYFIYIKCPEKSRNGKETYKLYDYEGNLCREYNKDDKYIKHCYYGGFKNIQELENAMVNANKNDYYYKTEVIWKAMDEFTEEYGKDSDIIKNLNEIYWDKYR